MNFLNKLFFRGIFALSFSLLLPSSADAFSFIVAEPEFRPGEPDGLVRNYRLFNDEDRLVAVEIQIVRRTTTVEGREMLEEADSEDRFFIIPSQLLLQPNEEQLITVQYMDSKAPSIEEAYRIIASEIDVNLDDDQFDAEGADSEARLSYLQNYQNAIYVTPTHAKADLKVDAIDAEHFFPGEKKLAFEVKNSGSKHAKMNDLHLVVKGGRKRVELMPKDLSGISGSNVLANSVRQFAIDWPNEIPEGAELALEISYSEE